jgi:hypothetical protein
MLHSQPQANISRPYLKETHYKKKGLREWLKQCLPSKHEALSSNPNAAIKKKKSNVHCNLRRINFLNKAIFFPAILRNCFILKQGVTTEALLTLWATSFFVVCRTFSSIPDLLSSGCQ